jgi:hypothetical protein
MGFASALSSKKETNSYFILMMKVGPSTGSILSHTQNKKCLFCAEITKSISQTTLGSTVPQNRGTKRLKETVSKT